jgi:very-short-patch-repair endonuclease
MPFEHWLTTPKEWYRLRPIAQARRRYPAPQVAALWERLRRRQIHRLEFRRQEAISGFLVDFFSYGALLAIVVDTPDLSGHLRPGTQRSRALDEHGILELRFTAEAIDSDIDAVVDRIAAAALERRRKLRILRARELYAPAGTTLDTGTSTLDHLQSSSTRTTVVRNSSDHGNGDRGNGDRGIGDRGNGDRGNGDRGIGDRGVGDRGAGDRDAGDRRIGEPCENYRAWPSSRRQWRRLRDVVKKQRQEGTIAEQLLWNRLRNRRLDGLAFRRQKALGDFVADFYCSEARLVIEIDGPIHDDSQARDAARTERLEAMGLTVLRFTNDQVTTNPESVLQTIHTNARRKPHSPLSVFGEGGRGGEVTRAPVGPM